MHERAGNQEIGAVDFAPRQRSRASRAFRPSPRLLPGNVYRKPTILAALHVNREEQSNVSEHQHPGRILCGIEVPPRILRALEPKRELGWLTRGLGMLYKSRSFARPTSWGEKLCICS